MVISPELADVSSTIIGRVRGNAAAIPLIPAYDRRECVWQAPTPWLFQRRFGGEQRRMSDGAVRNILTGEVSDEEDEDIQLCVSVPAGDVALDL